jgi:hypothetical protein
MAPLLSGDLGVTLGREVTVWVGAEIGTVTLVQVGSAAAAELGISAEILRTGAASGVATFGIGLVVAVLVDQLVGYLLPLAGYDAVAQISAKVKETLARTATLLLDGSEGQGGLRRELEKVHRIRSQLRGEAIRRLLARGGA